MFLLQYFLLVYCKSNMRRWSGAINDATDEWLPQWRHYPACPIPFLVTVSYHSDQWCVFYTPSLAILLTSCNQLNSNLTYLGATVNVEQILDVSSRNNSVVARVWSAFQVSQGSIGTLFRWGGKHLYHFAANLFRKQCTRFCQNRPCFIEIIENILVSVFFWTHCTVTFMINEKLVLVGLNDWILGSDSSQSGCL